MLNGINGGILAVAGIEAARTTDDFSSRSKSSESRSAVLEPQCLRVLPVCENPSAPPAQLWKVLKIAHLACL